MQALRFPPSRSLLLLTLLCGSGLEALANPADGARKVMAVLYQSCDAVRANPISPFPMDGVVSDRVPPIDERIRKARAVQEAVRYVSPQGSEKDPACFDVRANSLIYDFGGSPADLSKQGKPKLSLHRDAGTGRKGQLGIDCSNFVSTSYYAAGYKLGTKKLDLSATQFDALDTKRMIRAPEGDFDCLAPVMTNDPQGPLIPGDLIVWVGKDGKDGHVILVDQAGPDPLGISRVTELSRCTAEMISSRNFDFTFMHSSKDPDWIGVSRMDGANYFSEFRGETGFRLREIAAMFCRARLNALLAAPRWPFQALSPAKIEDPAAGPPLPPAEAKLGLPDGKRIAILRHRTVSSPDTAPAECRMPPVPLEHEECVSGCIELPELAKRATPQLRKPAALSKKGKPSKIPKTPATSTKKQEK